MMESERNCKSFAYRSRLSVFSAPGGGLSSSGSRRWNLMPLNVMEASAKLPQTKWWVRGFNSSRFHHHRPRSPFTVDVVLALWVDTLQLIETYGACSIGTIILGLNAPSELLVSTLPSPGSHIFLYIAPTSKSTICNLGQASPRGGHKAIER